MNLLLFTNLFPTPVDPERGVFTLQIAKQFNQHCNLTVVCPLPYFPGWSIFKRYRKWHELSQVPQQYQIASITVYSPKYLLLPKISERFHDWLMALSIKRFMHNLHAQKKFDVINSKWLYPDACVIDRIFRDNGIPHVTAGLGSDINYQFKIPAKRQKILAMLARADACITVSASLKDVLVADGANAEKIHVVHNGVDTSQFSPGDRQQSRTLLQLDQHKKIIVFVGRLSEEKGIPTLIHAMDKLTLTFKLDMPHLYLIGEGPMRATLTDLIATMQLAQHITLLGKVAHSDVSKWLAACNVFCLPSFNEGCPNVVLEALGSGRPVVASRVGAIPDIVNADSGILFEAGNVQQLSEALTKAINTDWDVQKIVNTIEKMSWSETASRYLDLFQQAIDKRKRE